jgi:hypothetical protein
MKKLMEIIQDALEHSMHVELSANWRHFDPLDTRRSVTVIVYGGLDIVETITIRMDDSEEKKASNQRDPKEEGLEPTRPEGEVTP